jgi:hypothetical protein
MSTSIYIFVIIEQTFLSTNRSVTTLTSALANEELEAVANQSGQVAPEFRVGNHFLAALLLNSSVEDETTDEVDEQQANNDDDEDPATVQTATRASMSRGTVNVEDRRELRISTIRSTPSDTSGSLRIADKSNNGGTRTNGVARTANITTFVSNLQTMARIQTSELGCIPLSEALSVDRSRTPALADTSGVGTSAITSATIRRVGTDRNVKSVSLTTRYLSSLVNGVSEIRKVVGRTVSSLELRTARGALSQNGGAQSQTD